MLYVNRCEAFWSRVGAGIVLVRCVFLDVGLLVVLVRFALKNVVAY